MRGGMWRKKSEAVMKVGYRRIHNKEFELPNGREGIWTTVDDGQTAAVCALTHEHRLVCVSQFRPGPERVILGAPGGFVDPAESPHDAARRELLEETGYAGEMQLVAVTPLDAYSGVTRHHFVATNCERITEPQCGPYECLQVDTLHPTELLAKIKYGNTGDEGTFLLGIIELVRLGHLPLEVLAQVEV
jgi:ADP-ribose diphosphatase